MSEAPEAITAYNKHLRGYSFTARGHHGTFGPVEYIRADIHAARIAELERQLAETREVKPLEWHKDADRPDDYPKWTADTGLGKPYFVFKAWWGAQDRWGFLGVDGFYHNEADAKAAAQADYTVRIHSALQSPGLSLSDARDQALEDAAVFIQSADAPIFDYSDGPKALADTMKFARVFAAAIRAMKGAKP